MMNSESSAGIRKAKAAGKFYPNDKTELLRLLEVYFNKNKAIQDQREIHALIVPHAGYNFSGETAAMAYTHINPDTISTPIFIIGQSHTDHFEGASVWAEGCFETPIGQIPVNESIGKLIKEHAVFSFPAAHHLEDHCIEVQLPFLQYKLNIGFEIVPILIGTKNRAIIKEISQILKPFFEKGNLMIISTDLSHYPGYADAIRCDFKITEAIQKNDVEYFIKTKETIESSNHSGLQTSLCGYGAVLSLIEITNRDDRFQYEKMGYTNSAASNNNYSQVVGYASLIVRDTGTRSNRLLFSNKDKNQLIRIARQSIQNAVLGLKDDPLINEECSSNLELHTGVFVTIRINEKLRGCIGTFNQSKCLKNNVAEMAEACAIRDPRFEPLSKEDLDLLSIEINVIGPLQIIEDIKDISIGKHGILIKRGNKTGTFLPQVAIEHKWSVEEMLGHCSKEKADIGWDGWKDKETKIYIFESYQIS